MGAVEAQGSKASHDPVTVALAALSNQRKSGSIIVGPIGSGKTFVLRAVVHEMSNAPRVSIRSPVLEVTGCGRGDLRELLKRRKSETSAPEARGSLVLVADDLDTWEPEAFGLLAEALDSGQVRLLATVRSSEAAEVLGRLRPALPAAVTRLEPWRLSDFSRVARTLLDAPLHAMTAQSLTRFAGGNPLCLAELIDQGRAANKLHRRFETWVWQGEINVPQMTLMRMSEQLLRQPVEVRDVLVSLCWAGRASLRLLQRAHPLTAIEAAEAAGFLTVTVRNGGHIEVSLSRPVEGEVALRLQPTLRRRVTGSRLVSAAIAERQDLSDHAVTAARLCVQLALSLPEPLLTGAVNRARLAHDTQLVLALTGPDSSLPALARDATASALVDECQFEDAARTLIDLAGDDTGAGPGQTSRRAALHAMASGTAPTTGTSASAHLLCASGWLGHDLDQSERAARELFAQEMPLPERARRLLALTSILAQQGKVEESVRLCNSVTPEALSAFEPSQRLALLAVLGLCHVARGAMVEAQSLAASLCSTATHENWRLAYGLGAFLAGRCALLKARPSSALRRLSESLASFEQAAPMLNRGVLLESLGAAYHLAGRAADADTAHRQAERETSACAPQIVLALARLTRAELQHVRGDRRGALGTATAAAAEYASSGQTLAALLALHLVCRIQATPDAVRDLRDVAARTDFPLAGIYVDHARALQEDHSTLLGEVAERYEQLGLLWLAAEAASAALSHGRSTVSARGTSRLKRMINRLNDEEPVALPAWWGSAVSYVVPLTEREKEIAAAAVSGGTSAEIAERLSLSRRTVENHLQHIFRKLGVTSREELGRSLNTPGNGVW